MSAGTRWMSWWWKRPEWQQGCMFKDGDAPVTSDENVLRRVSRNHYDPTQPFPVLYEAFRPRDNDHDGISVFREQCGATPAVVGVGPGRKGYVVAKLRVQD